MPKLVSNVVVQLTPDELGLLMRLAALRKSNRSQAIRYAIKLALQMQESGGPIPDPRPSPV